MRVLSRSIYLTMVLVLALVACTVPLAPDTPMKRWAVAQEQLTTMDMVAVRLSQEGRMGLKDAEQYDVIRKQVVTALDLAYLEINRKEDMRAEDYILESIRIIESGMIMLKKMEGST